MKNTFTLLTLILLFQVARGQNSTLSLEDCYRGLEENHPGYRQYRLNEEQFALQAKNLQTNFLPSLQWNAQATWQSTVTELPLDLSFAGLQVPGVSRDQYKTTLDLQQLIWDAGMTRKQQEALNLEKELASVQTEVNLYQLRDVVQKQFFSILLTREYLQMNSLMQENLKAALKKAISATENGLASKEEVNTLKAAELEAQAAGIALESRQKTSLMQLEKLTGLSIDPAADFQTTSPAMPDTTSLRPELKLFQVRQQWLDQQQEVIRAANAPKVSLFSTLGYGRPGLNFLSNDFEPFAIAGVAFRWNLSGKINGKENRDRQLLTVNRKKVGVEAENFKLQIGILANQLFNKLEELETISALEAEQLELRSELRKLNEARLASGTTTASDYLNFLNKENESGIKLAINHIEQLFTIEQIKFINGQP